ncbi:hypothetical protein H6G94_24070 [Nostoc punctiforme FACHB-252]|uniref:TrbI/VirB10 family protein n=1 Tax=Nostoc punctiforme FACHB-252 TaxID=1357509 RepID=A0ABR8HET3_NOSPU|nr:TrbI/VirB10 family protein [Nostoc punctiforme]MBD2614312.1 hypothetical protein [Nostoc punctiforme FACHB-252]
MDSNSFSSEDASEFESKMAKLVGLEEENTIDIGGIPEDSVALQLESPELETVVTNEPFSSNPFAKLGLVGGVTLVIVMLVGGFLSHLISYKNQKPRTKTVDLVIPSPPIPSREESLEEEIEILKTKLALVEQAQTIIEAQQNLRIAATPVSKVKVEQSKYSTASKPRISTPVRTVYVPRTVIIARPIQNPHSQRVTPPQNSTAALPQVLPSSVANSDTKPSPPDLLQEWANLAKFGSYGEVYLTPQFGVNSTNTQSENTNVASQLNNHNSNSNSSQQLQKRKFIKVGSTARGVIATAIFAETNNSSNSQKKEIENVFIVRLQEALKATDGTIVLPENIELLTKINSISEQGLLYLSAVKFISFRNGELIETNLPNNAIMIHSIQGKPLIASKYSNLTSSIASMDAGLFVMAGINKAAELLNRSDTTYQYRDINNNPQTLTNYNKRNIAAGILEGGFNYLVPQIAQRNQQAITQMLQKTNIWFLPAGKEVEIYVNHTVQF